MLLNTEAHYIARFIFLELLERSLCNNNILMASINTLTVSMFVQEHDKRNIYNLSCHVFCHALNRTKLSSR